METNHEKANNDLPSDGEGLSQKAAREGDPLELEKAVSPNPRKRGKRSRLLWELVLPLLICSSPVVVCWYLQHHPRLNISFPMKPMQPPPPPKPTLTRPQQTVLDAILFFQRKGELPTVREIGSLVGHRSSATVFKHLRALERAKLISMNGKSRGIRITDPSLLLKGTMQKGLSAPLALQPTPIRPAGRQQSVPLVGAIAAGRPFESYSDGFLDGFEDGFSPDLELEIERSAKDNRPDAVQGHAIPIDPRLFAESGELLALRVEGDSMVNAGILDGDYVIIRRQNTVEEGDIAAVIINGEGTLKRWHVRSRKANGQDSAGNKTTIQLAPANERFDPIEITEDDAKDVLVFGKYVGLVRGNLQLF